MNPSVKPDDFRILAAYYGTRIVAQSLEHAGASDADARESALIFMALDCERLVELAEICRAPRVWS